MCFAEAGRTRADATAGAAAEAETETRDTETEIGRKTERGGITPARGPGPGLTPGNATDGEIGTETETGETGTGTAGTGIGTETEIGAREETSLLAGASARRAPERTKSLTAGRTNTWTVLLRRSRPSATSTTAK